MKWFSQLACFDTTEERFERAEKAHTQAIVCWLVDMTQNPIAHRSVPFGGMND